MIKRELAKDPNLANESWDRFLPNFKKRTLSKRRVPQNVTDKSKKPYTAFPPAPEKSKIDLQIESGEYFLGKEAKKQFWEYQAVPHQDHHQPGDEVYMLNPYKSKLQPEKVGPGVVVETQPNNTYCVEGLARKNLLLHHNVL